MIYRGTKEATKMGTKKNTQKKKVSPELVEAYQRGDRAVVFFGLPGQENTTVATGPNLRYVQTAAEDLESQGYEAAAYEFDENGTILISGCEECCEHKNPRHVWARCAPHQDGRGTEALSCGQLPTA
jgi:hypothetical protein